MPVIPGNDGGEHQGGAQQKHETTLQPAATVPPTVPNADASSPGNEGDGSEKKRKFWSDYTPVEKFTLALLISNVLYVLTYATWVFLDQSPDLNAYLMDNLMRPGSGPIKVMVNITNTGKATAYDVKFRYRVKVVKVIDRPSIEGILSDGETSALGIEMPTQSATKIRIATREVITQEQNTELGKQESTLALVAVVSGSYRDRWYIPHTFLRCGIWKFEENAFNGCAWPSAFIH